MGIIDILKNTTVVKYEPLKEVTLDTIVKMFEELEKQKKKKLMIKIPRKYKKRLKKVAKNMNANFLSTNRKYFQKAKVINVKFGKQFLISGNLSVLCTIIYNYWGGNPFRKQQISFDITKLYEKLNNNSNTSSNSTKL